MTRAAAIAMFAAGCSLAALLLSAAVTDRLVVAPLAPAVVLAWPPQTNGGYCIVSATNLNGPWTLTTMVPFPAGSFTNPAAAPAQFFRAYTVLENTNGAWTVTSLSLLTNTPPAGSVFLLVTN